MECSCGFVTSFRVLFLGGFDSAGFVRRNGRVFELFAVESADCIIWVSSRAAMNTATKRIFKVIRTAFARFFG